MKKGVAYIHTEEVPKRVSKSFETPVKFNFFIPTNTKEMQHNFFQLHYTCIPNLSQQMKIDSGKPISKLLLIITLLTYIFQLLWHVPATTYSSAVNHSPPSTACHSNQFPV